MGVDSSTLGCAALLLTAAADNAKTIPRPQSFMNKSPPGAPRSTLCTKHAAPARGDLGRKPYEVIREPQYAAARDYRR